MPFRMARNVWESALTRRVRRRGTVTSRGPVAAHRHGTMSTIHIRTYIVPPITPAPWPWPRGPGGSPTRPPLVPGLALLSPPHRDS